jgi:hypothetical protein
MCDLAPYFFDMMNPDGALRETEDYSILAPEWPAVKARFEARFARR